MNISDNILSAFFCGASTLQEDLTVFNELTVDESMQEIFDATIEIDSMPDISELKNEFNSRIDAYSDFKEHKLKIR